MATPVRSFSKINLGLAVGPARADGFHGLTTVYQTLALHDLVTVSARPAAATTVVLEADHPGVPTTATGDAERNTAWRIVSGALVRMGVTAEVTIQIEKRLPVQGGLGAGSANAAAALLGLERELRQALPQREQLELAAEVGSDVPLFLLGGTVLGLGRGEQVYPLADLPATWCVIAVPAVGVSTAAAFRELDLRMELGGPGRSGLDAASEMRGSFAPLEDDGEKQATATPAADEGLALTFQQAQGKLEKLSCAYAAVWKTDGVEFNPSGITRADQAEEPVIAQRGDLAETPGFPSNLLDGMVNPLLALVRTGIENDFEEVAFSQHPSLRSTKRELLGSSGTAAIFAGLSGSGSALFGLYRSEADARAAQHRVQASGTRAILTETLTRAAYWHTMFAESLDG
jgi:4-diphosphocytidyl-2-C-methyl-D-erythritol kinase